MKKTWGFLINPFLTATDESYRNAYRISTFHQAALTAASNNSFFSGLLASYTPIHTAYETAYNQWVQQGGQQVSETVHIQQLFKLLNQKIKTWDIAIQNVYEDTTPAYIRLLPHKRKPFQNGTQMGRITSLKNLADAIGSDAALNSVKKQVDAFHFELEDAIAVQKTAISKKGISSDAVEAQRIIMCNTQFDHLGKLISHFSTNPAMIEGYFDTRHIRQGAQSLFTGSLAPGEIHFIAKRTFAAEDEIELENTGTTSISFYLADKKTAVPNAAAVTLAAGSSQTVIANNLGELTHHFLMVKNDDLINNGSFELNIE